MIRRWPMLAALPAAILGFLLLVRFRRRAVARFNRAVTNRITRPFAGWAPGFGLVIHRGRTSGRLYRTPVNLFREADGFSIALTYGPRSEWVQNVLAGGGCVVETRGRRYRCSNPAIVHDPRHARFPLPLRIVPAIGGVTDYLRLSAIETASAPVSSAVSNGAVG
jgi:deazaflavin-dependent oxidoreductase (nitroreductase family)